MVGDKLYSFVFVCLTIESLDVDNRVTYFDVDVESTSSPDED